MTGLLILGVATGCSLVACCWFALRIYRLDGEDNRG